MRQSRRARAERGREGVGRRRDGEERGGRLMAPEQGEEQREEWPTGCGLGKISPDRERHRNLNFDSLHFGPSIFYFVHFFILSHIVFCLKSCVIIAYYVTHFFLKKKYVCDVRQTVV
jgi:hypothetical protein